MSVGEYGGTVEAHLVLWWERTWQIVRILWTTLSHFEQGHDCFITHILANTPNCLIK